MDNNILNNAPIIAYKGFGVDDNGDLNCRGMRYKVGEIATVDGKIELCGNGIHFCHNINSVHQFYNLHDNVICKVEVLGEIVNDSDMSKSVTNKIKVLEILTKEQILSISNTGTDNTGLFNSGYGNSGDRNSGDRNSGNWNSGDRNSGYGNSGDRNSGDRNSGDRNSGNWNSGNWNSGYGNSGNWNSGNWNSGNWNSGNRNSGYGNSGDRNSGNRNSGNRNSGNWNSGDRNSGYGNSGDMHKKFVAVFCTDYQHIAIFNSPVSNFDFDTFFSNMNKLNLILTEWVKYTNEEKANDKAKELIGGYLIAHDYKDAWRTAWSNASKELKAYFANMVNFDKDIFHEITGIEV